MTLYWNKFRKTWHAGGCDIIWIKMFKSNCDGLVKSYVLFPAQKICLALWRPIILSLDQKNLQITLCQIQIKAPGAMTPYRDSLRVSSPPFWRHLPGRCSLPRLSSSRRILRPWSLGHAGAWHWFVGRIRTWWLQLRLATVALFEVIGLFKHSTFCNTHLFSCETQVVKLLTLLTGQLDRFGHFW